MSRRAHNKLTTKQVQEYATDMNIRLIDREYVSNSHLHQWECGRCKSIVAQRLDKIKRANGKLNCCSRVSKENVEKGKNLAERWGITFNELTFKNTQVPSEWSCPTHGVFEYPLFNALRAKSVSPCPDCREDAKQLGLKKELEELYKEVPFIKLIDEEYKGKRVSHKWKCETHNYETTSSLSLIKNNKRLRCCRGESYRGKNHPFYNPEITDSERVKKRNYNKSYVWSKAVRNRDGWKCIICGHNSKCVAHHLDSYMAFPLKRYDVDNGVTLCRPHHIDFHKKYGIKKTTKKQFEEYYASHSR